MKATVLILSLLTASVASTRSLFSVTNQNALVDEPQFSVPGKNPLNVRKTAAALSHTLY
jgi:hypothetical protein